VTIGDGALGGQGGGDLTADAAAGPGDEGDLSLEVDEHWGSSLIRSGGARQRIIPCLASGQAWRRALGALTLAGGMT
jgi:hypothetical protein